MKANPLHLSGLLLLLFPLLALSAVRYVDLNSANPTPPYTDWSTAATNINDAIGAADPGDQILVTNGVYATGGRTAVGFLLTTNRVAVTKPVLVQSVNGPSVTIIQGYQMPGITNGGSSVRCVYLTNGAMLAGFTLTNGATAALTNSVPVGNFYGGGIFCLSSNSIASNCIIVGNAAGWHGGGVVGGYVTSSTIAGNVAHQNGGGGAAASSVLSNCLITANFASTGGGVNAAACYDCLISSNNASGAFGGGGAVGGTLNNCKLVGNSSYGPGGGAYDTTLNNCLVLGNVARTIGGGVFYTASGSANSSTIVSNIATISDGGGVRNGGATNCIIQFNYSSSGLNNSVASKLKHCSTEPMPTSVYDGGGNITNYPAFVSPASGDFRQQSNSPCINSGQNADPTVINDLDGNPRISGGTVDIGAYEFQNPASKLSYYWAQQYGLPTDGSADYTDDDNDGMNNWQEFIANTIPTNAASLLVMYAPSNNAPGVKLSWQSVSGRSYFIQRSTNFSTVPIFRPLATNLNGVAGTMTYTDASATNDLPYFYRVGVRW